MTLPDGLALCGIPKLRDAPVGNAHANHLEEAFRAIAQPALGVPVLADDRTFAHPFQAFLLLVEENLLTPPGERADSGEADTIGGPFGVEKEHGFCRGPQAMSAQLGMKHV